MDVIAPVDAVEKTVGCPCETWSTFDKLETGFCDRNMGECVMNVTKWYWVETLPSKSGSPHLLSATPALHKVRTEMSGSHHQVYVNRC